MELQGSLYQLIKQIAFGEVKVTIVMIELVMTKHNPFGHITKKRLKLFSYRNLLPSLSSIDFDFC